VPTGITGYMNISSPFPSTAPYGNETDLMYASAAHVVSIAIDASSSKFQMYDSGVYDDASCKNRQDLLDHGVTLVGYGVDNKVDYWYVRNPHSIYYFTLAQPTHPPGTCATAGAACGARRATST
jgi:hypothetical protein